MPSAAIFSMPNDFAFDFCEDIALADPDQDSFLTDESANPRSIRPGTTSKWRSLDLLDGC
jgi:hypothetical protein